MTSSVPAKECKIVADILKRLQKDGWVVWKHRSTVYAVRDTRLIALEVKKPGRKTTALQDRWLRQLNLQGVPACVVKGVDDLDVVVDDVESASTGPDGPAGPCPFCGADPYRIRETGFYDSYGIRHKKGCYLEHGQMRDVIGAHEVAAWNARAEADESDPLTREGGN